MELYLYYYCYILHYFLGEQWPIVAVATIKTPSGIKGNVTFEQECCTCQVKITAVVEGLKSCHGFHIHQLGDLTNGCTSLGPHWNPSESTHGNHVGDLPELCIKNSSNVATLDLEKDDLFLAGPLSIVGRSIVIHERRDDFGKGGTPDSLTTGNSGPRIACAIIGLKSTPISIPNVEHCSHGYYA